MANYYVDFASGNDTTGDGSAGNPWKTYSKAQTSSTTDDEIRIAKTTINNAVDNVTFTVGSTTVNTTSSFVGTITSGMFIGKPTASGNGTATDVADTETYYKVASVTASTIVLQQKYFGTTETVASFNYLTPVDCAVVNPLYASQQRTISGGWNLSTELQDGETWYTSSSNTTTSNHYMLYVGTDATVSKVNCDCANSHYGIYVNGTLDHIYTYGGYYYNNIQSGSYVTNCVLSTSYVGNTLSYPTSISAAVANFDNNLLLGLATRTTIFNFGNGTDLTGKTNIIHGGSYGFTSGAMITGNLTVQYCTYAHYSYTQVLQAKCNSNEDLIFQYNTYGVYNNNDAYGYQIYIRNAQFIQNTRSVHAYRARNMIVRECYFESNDYDVYISDSYAGRIEAIGNTHITPLTYAYYLATSQANCPCLLKGCSIDAASTARFANFPTSATYVMSPNWAIQGCNAVDDGTYYPCGSYTVSSAVLSPSGNRTGVFVFSTTTSYLYNPIPIAKCYVGSGQGKNLSIYYKTTGSWSGSLIPYAVFNGRIVATGGTITNITSDWQVLQISVPDNLITSSGELSLEIDITGNTSPVYFGDFSAQEV